MYTIGLPLELTLFPARSNEHLTEAFDDLKYLNIRLIYESYLNFSISLFLHVLQVFHKLIVTLIN